MKVLTKIVCAGLLFALFALGCSTVTEMVGGEASDIDTPERSDDAPASVAESEADEEQKWKEYEAGEDTMTRWHHRPQRCRGADAWNDAVSGAEPVPHSIFQSSPNDELSPDDRVVRYICGANVEDIESALFENDATWDHTFRSTDPRLTMAEALDDPDTPETRRNLYSAVLAHKCWYATKWEGSIDTSYNAFLHCQEVASDLPSVDEVEDAMDAEFSGHDFELANIRFAHQRALDSRDEVMELAREMEETYPKQRQVYYEAAKRAEEEHRQRQQDYGHIIELVEPITHNLFYGSADELPDDCSATARRARAKLADNLGGIDDADDLRNVRAGHPVGYQITEALVHCYINEGQQAAARVEASALRDGTRRVTLGEEIRIARQEALHEVKAEHENLSDVVPMARMGTMSRIPLPTETYRTPNFFREISDAGSTLDTIGGPDTGDDNGLDDETREFLERQGMVSDRSAPVIDVLEEVDAGVRLNFVRKTETITRQERECYETDRIKSWTIDGDEVIPNYEVRCRFVGDPWEETIEHQQDPVVVPTEQAALLEEGMRVEVMINRHTQALDGDAIVRHAWPGDDPEAEPVVIDGMDMR